MREIKSPPLPKSPAKDPFGWFGNVNPDSLSEVSSFFWKEPILSHSLPAPPLGPTNPCPNAVHTEPFSTSVFNQKSQLNICYFHQDLHKGPLHACSRTHFKAYTLASRSSRPPTGSNVRNINDPQSIGYLKRTLERHPFSGLVDSAGELLHTP